MGAREARLVFAHLLADFRHGRLDRRIHVVRLRVGLDRDVVRAVEDDLARLPVLLHVEDGVGLDDARVVQVQVAQLLRDEGAQGFGDGDVAAGDPEGDVDVGALHGGKWAAESSSYFFILHLHQFRGATSPADEDEDEEDEERRRYIWKRSPR